MEELASLQTKDWIHLKTKLFALNNLQRRAMRNSEKVTLKSKWLLVQVMVMERLADRQLSQQSVMLSWKNQRVLNLNLIKVSKTLSNSFLTKS